MKKLFLTLLTVFTVGSLQVNAQEAKDLPPNAEPGKCYAKCIVADEWSTKTEEILVKEASTRIEIIPAVYTTVTETLVVKEASQRIEEIPAIYQDASEKIMVEPASTKWVKGKADPSCLSADPNDCSVMCLVEVPAVYKTVYKRVLKSPASTRVIEIPAEYKFVDKRVVQTPAKTKEITIPAEYKTITKTVLTRKGGMTEWKEVLCGKDMTTAKIRSIQMALKNAGYDPGPLDNVLGAKTRAALLQYQKDNKLPQGNLNKETLKHLGVE